MSNGNERFPITAYITEPYFKHENTMRLVFRTSESNELSVDMTDEELYALRTTLGNYLDWNVVNG